MTKGGSILSGYSLQLITPPTAAVLDVAWLRDWLRVDIADDDDVIARLVLRVVDQAQRLTGRQFLTATWRMGLAEFPASGLIRMPKAPLQAVSAITYADAANVTQTLAASDYDVDAASDPGTVSLAYGKSWPATYRKPNAVELTFVAGYGVPQQIPPGILQALERAVAYAYTGRGDDPEASEILTRGVQAELATHWNGCLEYGEVG